MKHIVLTIFSVFCLCVVFLTSGVMLCMNTPQITDGLCKATALVDAANFSRDQLVEIADKTRAFVAGEVEKNDVYSTIQKINKEANTQYSNIDIAELHTISDDFSLDNKSISHLDDVRDLFANIKILFFLCLAGAVAFLLLTLFFGGTNYVGKAFLYSGLIVLGLIVGFIVWIIADFDGMFNWLHSLFFTTGTWIFSNKSLLISMYPNAFWTGMSIICVVTSIVLSTISTIVGKIIK